MAGLTDVRDAVGGAVPQSADASPGAAAPGGPPAGAPLRASVGRRAVSAAPLSAPAAVLALADRHRRALFAGVLVLYLLGFNGQWRMEPDSALYLTIARNLAEGRGYTYHGHPESLAYPGVPWMFAAIFKVFGTRSLVPAHVVMLGIGLATLALTYRLFRLHAGRPTAVLVTIGLAVSRTFYRYCFELLSDMPFLLGVMAFLAGYEALFGADRSARRGTSGRVLEENGHATGGGGGHADAPAGDPNNGHAGVGAARRPRSASGRDVEPDVDVDADFASAPLSPRRRGRRGRWYDVALMLSGLGVAVVTRPTMYALLLAIVGAVVWSMFARPVRWGRVAACLGMLAAAAGTALAFRALDPRRGAAYEQAVLHAVGSRLGEVAHRFYSENLPQLFDPATSEAMFGMDSGPANYVFSAMVLASAVLLFRRRALWGLWVASTLAMMLVTLVEVRYFLQALPLLVYGWWLGLVWLWGRLPRRCARGVFLTLLTTASAVNLVRVGSLVVEQRRLPFLEHYRRGQYAAVPEVVRVLEEYTEPGAWVLTRYRTGRILTNLSGRNAIEPQGRTDVDPARQPVYILHPIDEGASKWMVHNPHPMAPGEPLGPEVKGRRGRESWQLYRVVPRDPASPPTLASTPPPAAGLAPVPARAPEQPGAGAP